VSQQAVSKLEAGRIDGMTVRVVGLILGAVDAEFVPQLRWRGGELDRVADEGHARLVGEVAAMLRRDGWEVAVEVSFSVFGERGSIDLLAWHAATRSLLVIEVKTTVNSVEETLRRHDQKSRLASRIAAERFGWRARSVSRLLVVRDAGSARARVERHSAVLDSVYPSRAWAVRSWLAAPVGALAGLMLVRTAGAGGGTSRTSQRGRIRRRAGAPRSVAPGTPPGGGTGSSTGPAPARARSETPPRA